MSKRLAADAAKEVWRRWRRADVALLGVPGIFRCARTLTLSCLPSSQESGGGKRARRASGGALRGTEAVRAFVLLVLRAESALGGLSLAALADAVTDPAGAPRPVGGKTPADAMSADAFALVRKAVADAHVEIDRSNPSNIVRQLKEAARGGGGDREQPVLALLRGACGLELDKADSPLRAALNGLVMGEDVTGGSVGGSVEGGGGDASGGGGGGDSGTSDDGDDDVDCLDVVAHAPDASTVAAAAALSVAALLDACVSGTEKDRAPRRPALRYVRAMLLDALRDAVDALPVANGGGAPPASSAPAAAAAPAPAAASPAATRGATRGAAVGSAAPAPQPAPQTAARRRVTAAPPATPVVPAPAVVAASPASAAARASRQDVASLIADVTAQVAAQVTARVLAAQGLAARSIGSDAAASSTAGYSQWPSAQHSWGPPPTPQPPPQWGSPVPSWGGSPPSWGGSSAPPPWGPPPAWVPSAAPSPHLAWAASPPAPSWWQQPQQQWYAFPPPPYQQDPHGAAARQSEAQLLQLVRDQQRQLHAQQQEFERELRAFRGDATADVDAEAAAALNDVSK